MCSSDLLVGNISFYDSTGQNDYGFTKPFSEHTAETIDAEVRRIVEEAYARAKEIITSHRVQLDSLAAQLYEKEVLFREDLEKIYGPRPWEVADPSKNEDETKQIEAETHRSEDDVAQDSASTPA